MLFTLPSISKLMNEPEVTSDMIFSQTTAYYNTILTIYAVYRMHTVHSKHIFCIHKVPRCAVFVKMCNKKELNEGNTICSHNPMHWIWPSISSMTNDLEVLLDMIFNRRRAHYQITLTISAVDMMHTVHTKQIVGMHKNLKAPNCAIKKELNACNTAFHNTMLQLTFYFQNDIWTINDFSIHEMQWIFFFVLYTIIQCIGLDLPFPKWRMNLKWYQTAR